jgi:hypothetical protein
MKEAFIRLIADSLRRRRHRLFRRLPSHLAPHIRYVPGFVDIPPNRPSAQRSAGEPVRTDITGGRFSAAWTMEIRAKHLQSATEAEKFCYNLWRKQNWPIATSPSLPQKSCAISATNGLISSRSTSTVPTSASSNPSKTPRSLGCLDRCALHRAHRTRLEGAHLTVKRLEGVAHYRRHWLGAIEHFVTKNAITNADTLPPYRSHATGPLRAKLKSSFEQKADSVLRTSAFPSVRRLQTALKLRNKVIYPAHENAPLH